jgi:RNA polymerase sigma factor (sigma-70 family)
MPHNQNDIPTASLVDRFEKIYASTYSGLYSFVQYYVWSDVSVKDVLQECYIRLWENLSEIKDDEKLMPMLRTYAMNLTIDAVRKKARDIEKAAVFHSRQAPVPAADEGLKMREALRLYREAVAALPPRQRTVYTLSREKGLSYQEISEQLGISTNTIKRHMQEATHTLRSKFPAEILSLLIIISRLK